jgi:photosynthetic reaction center H subunit
MSFWGSHNYVDTTQVVLYIFWAFFAGLVIYLQREAKREGFPLVSEIDPFANRLSGDAWPTTPEPKKYRLMDGHLMMVPPGSPPRLPEGARPAAGFPGAPLEATGNPLVDGIGPASWCYRIDEPEIDSDGSFKITPLRVEPILRLHPNSPDPRGWSVVGADGLSAGTVVDIWVDALEEAVLYFEISLTVPGAEGDRVLLPSRFAQYRSRLRVVKVRAILSTQFAQVPRLRHPDQITPLEEDKLVGYFGGGDLFATPSRSGPLL